MQGVCDKFLISYIYGLKKDKFILNNKGKLSANWINFIWRQNLYEFVSESRFPIASYSLTFDIEQLLHSKNHKIK